MFSALGKLTGANSAEIIGNERKIKEEKEASENMENETRAEQVKCESELKNISVSLNGTHWLLNKDYKELKRKIDHLNETIQNLTVLLELEKGQFTDTIGKQREYIEIIYSIISKNVLYIFSVFD